MAYSTNRIPFLFQVNKVMSQKISPHQLILLIKQQKQN